MSSRAKCTCCTLSAWEAGSSARVHILLAALLFYCKLMQKTPRVEIKLSAALCKMACTVRSSETDYWVFQGAIRLEVSHVGGAAERMKRCQQRGGQIKLLRSHFPRRTSHTSLGMTNNALVTRHWLQLTEVLLHRWKVWSMSAISTPPESLHLTLACTVGPLTDGQYAGKVCSTSILPWSWINDAARCNALQRPC